MDTDRTPAAQLRRLAEHQDNRAADFSERLKQRTAELSEELDAIGAPPGIVVYNPLAYARPAHEAYLDLFRGPRRIVIAGMNPGPWGMVQTGVPFGNVGHARQIVTLRSILPETPLDHLVSTPSLALASRPVLGYRCVRDEVSGRRLWEGLCPLWAPPEEEAQALDLIPGYNRSRDLLRRMLGEVFVMNLCPLAFFEDGPRATNVTPDKLPTAWRDRFVGDSSPCHSYFSHILDTFRPEVVLVMGDWVERTVRRWSGEARLVRLPHPSPANPAANRGWAAAAQRILREAGLPWRS